MRTLPMEIRYAAMMNERVDDGQIIADIYDDVAAEVVYKYQLPEFLWIRKHWAKR